MRKKMISELCGRALTFYDQTFLCFVVSVILQLKSGTSISSR